MTLQSEATTLAYDGLSVCEDLSVEIPDGELTVIIGPNACGKSTLLKALARLMAPSRGRVLLDGRDLRELRTKDLARRLGLLPQSSIAPPAITVADLVARGRFPHQGLLRQWSEADQAATRDAMEATGVADLADRVVDELSGGQRQRAWLAMVLAQQTELLLLDEPTTFLDIAHQIEVLDLCERLHEAGGRTIVAVLHDLNQAARYATHLIAMHDGEVVAEGPPSDVLTPGLIAEVFQVRAHVGVAPETGRPLIVPLGLVS